MCVVLPGDFPSSYLQHVRTPLNMRCGVRPLPGTPRLPPGLHAPEFGIDDLIDHFWGDDLLSDMVCGVVGLSLVFWVRLSKMRIMRLDMWR